METQIKERIDVIKEGKIPPFYKKTKDGIYPVDWDNIRLGDHLELFTDKSKNDGKIPILTSSRNGLMLQKDYYANRELTVGEESEYGVLPRGYFTYRHMSDDFTFKFNINNLVDKGLVSPEYPVFTTKGIDDLFLLQKLNEGNEFKRYAIINKKGSTRTRMYFSVLIDLEIICPNIKEQIKIAKILTTWDKAINLKNKLILQKKKQKNGFMQKLLTGEVRLEGDKEEWKEIELGQVANIIKGEQLNRTDMVDNGEYPALNGGIEPSGYTHKWNTEQDTITISEGGNSCGYVNFIHEKFWCGGHCYKVNPDNNLVDKMFLYQLLKYKEPLIMRQRVGSGLPNIQKKSITSLIIHLPPKDEQLKISKLLAILDKDIDLNEKILLELMLQKKGLMQLLLTGIVRVQE